MRRYVAVTVPTCFQRRSLSSHLHVDRVRCLPDSRRERVVELADEVRYRRGYD